MRSSTGCWLLVAALSASACGGVPDSIRAYAGELPARADGQYAVLDDVLKKQLVMKDALLQCSIDQADKVEESASAACKCATSASEPWTVDCSAWLGEHTPAPEEDTEEGDDADADATPSAEENT